MTDSRRLKANMPEIKVDHLTKDYGVGRGVFDVSFEVGQGECFGYLGPNGAGKTTTIRHIMGFSKPGSGACLVTGLDSRKNAAVIQRSVGYLPGEIALPAGLTGTEFLDMMAKLRGMKSRAHLNMLLDRFELDPNIGTKKMSLGVKRKLAIVAAFMHDPAILVLDEPTSGLDPVMQEIFVNFILAEKKRGKTILLSSHIFSEVDATCDRIAIIKDGSIVSQFEADELKKKSDKVYQIEFATDEAYADFMRLGWELSMNRPEQRKVKVPVNDAEINRLIRDTAPLPMHYIKEIKFTLEDYFMKFYREDKSFEGVK